MPTTTTTTTYLLCSTVIINMYFVHRSHFTLLCVSASSSSVWNRFMQQGAKEMLPLCVCVFFFHFFELVYSALLWWLQSIFCSLSLGEWTSALRSKPNDSNITISQWIDVCACSNSNNKVWHSEMPSGKNANEWSRIDRNENKWRRNDEATINIKPTGTHAHTDTPSST